MTATLDLPRGAGKHDSAERELSSLLGRVAEGLDPQPHPYRNDPVGWIQNRLGEYPWSKQREVAQSVVDHRYTSVPSAHQTGKSKIASWLAAWWIDVHPPGTAFVVTSAPTDKQVKAILWREIGRAQRQADLPGRITLEAEWYVQGELVAYGRKPADRVSDEEAMQAFQGIHADNVLVILDEGGGVPKWLFDAADSLIAQDDSDESRGRVLCIGNPDNPASHFAEVCKPGSGWNTIRISALDTPNFTGEKVPDKLKRVLVGEQWVRERIKRWGKSSPIFISKVLGRFPKVGEDTLISPELLERAIARDLSKKRVRIAGRYGIDIADTGQDQTVFYFNRGGRVRLAEMPDGTPCVWHGQDTMVTVGKIKNRLKADKGETGAVVDAIGVGSPVVSRLRELELPVRGFVSSAAAKRPDKFKNARSEMWWNVRELFEADEIDIDGDDLDLIAQLGAIKWKVDSQGRTQIEPKEDMKKRLGGNSPDRADAFAYSTVNWDHLLPIDERGTAPSEYEDLTQPEIDEFEQIMEVAL